MSIDLNAKLIERTEVSPGLVILRIAPDGWLLPDFEPGQFAVVGVPGDTPRCDLALPEATPPAPDKLIKRAYSIASSSLAKEYIELYISLVPSGTLTPRLFALKPGDKLWLGPKLAGSFTLDDVPTDKQLILISTGTGLAPYMSMLRSSLACDERRKMAVLHGARHSWELGYRHELDMLAHQCSSFTYIPAISRPGEENIPWTGETGHIQEVWKKKPLAERWGTQPTAADSHVFLCGNPDMIEEMLHILVLEGFVENTRKVAGHIHLERFW